MPLRHGNKHYWQDLMDNAKYQDLEQCLRTRRDDHFSGNSSNSHYLAAFNYFSNVAFWLLAGNAALLALIKDDTSFERSKSEAGRVLSIVHTLCSRLLHLLVRRPSKCSKPLKVNLGFPALIAVNAVFADPIQAFPAALTIRKRLAASRLRHADPAALRA